MNLLLLLAYSGAFGRVVSSERMENWATVFMSLLLQALPFLVMGVVISAAVSTLIPSPWLQRAVPTQPLLAVPAACALGAALPGCECSAAPVAGRLIERGVPQAAALTFLLSSPAINPIVVVSTVVAFPNQPKVALARFVASFAAAIVIGWIWQRFAPPDLLQQRLQKITADHQAHAFSDTAIADFTQAGGYLVLGAALVASFQAMVPSSAFDRIGGDGPIAIAVLAGLAMVLSVCSEADAFVAAGLTRFSLTARLVFMTVGPMVDLKLIALQAGTFGRAMASRFAPLTFVVCVASALLVGRVLL